MNFIAFEHLYDYKRRVISKSLYRTLYRSKINGKKNQFKRHLDDSI